MYQITLPNIKFYFYKELHVHQNNSSCNNNDHKGLGVTKHFGETKNKIQQKCAWTDKT